MLPLVSQRDADCSSYVLGVHFNKLVREEVHPPLCMPLHTLRCRACWSWQQATFYMKHRASLDVQTVQVVPLRPASPPHKL